MKVSVVVPVYGCSGSLKELTERIFASLGDRDEVEVVLVCDGDVDGSWPVTVSLSDRDKRVRGIRLMKNSGQHQATAAGLRASSGDVVVVMDCDLADRPEDIPRLLEMLSGEVDLVVAFSGDRSADKLAHRSMRRGFHRLSGALSGEEWARRGLNFSFFAASRRLVDAMNRCNERRRQTSALLMDLAGPYVVVPVEHDSAQARPSTYSVRSRIRVALETLHLSSGRFLRRSAFLSALGFLTALLLASAYLIYRFFFATASLPGWLSTIVALLVLISLQFLTISFLALLSNELLHEIRGRPSYVVRDDTRNASSAPIRGSGQSS